jgi:ribosomal protein L40E
MSWDSKQREQVVAGVEAALGNKVICNRCGATLETYGDKCSADLAEACEGFRAIEEVRMPLVRQIYRPAQ